MWNIDIKPRHPYIFKSKPFSVAKLVQALKLGPAFLVVYFETEMLRHSNLRRERKNDIY